MKNSDIAERRVINGHQTVYQMYCESVVCDRLQTLRDKMADKNLMFKFNGNHYAIFVLDVFDRTQITDYTLTLEQVEKFAENV